MLFIYLSFKFHAFLFSEFNNTVYRTRYHEIHASSLFRLHTEKRDVFAEKFVLFSFCTRAIAEASIKLFRICVCVYRN